jgi:hypothetical protein
MPSKSPAVVIELRKSFSPTPPQRITQQAFDHDEKHLRRLVRLRPGDFADARDLWEYTQDLLYTDIQSDLLVFLLPFCLEAWRQDLLGTSQQFGGFVENFYPVLANRHIFDAHLNLAQSAAVASFMRSSILEEVRNQRGLFYDRRHARPYRWISAMTTYGVLIPDIDRLWTTWWALTDTGSAIAFLQYGSCLIYPENENPVFAPWTAERGGGPPCLWEFEGHLYTNRWMEANVTFLEQALNPKNIGAVLTKASDKLEDLPEYAKASEIFSDLPLCGSTLEMRCARLPQILRTAQQPGVLLDW